MSDYDLQTIKEEIRARTDIVEIIGGYTRLKKAGKNWTGLCPFHNDKKPSFNVSPQLGIYKCFSCGEAGDLFKFVQKKENLDFMEALEWLAKRAGIAFERKAANPEKVSEREEAWELNQLAVKFYRQCLKRSPEAQAYLANRALLVETQEQWEIGFAPPTWDALTYHLEQARANMELAVQIGLLKTREGQGGYYDAFRNRLMFPIHDLQGRVIAFGGRAMSADEQAKYLNSPQSLLFDKSNTLYGLYFARKKLLNGDTPPVFVEGYVDVITTHQAGFTQCVATLGTSMTEPHARMLVRYNPRVIICYDGDSAGIKATLRGATVWESIGVENADVRVARLPTGDDPDSLLKRGETALFQAALDDAIPRVDFQIELALKRHDHRSEQGRADALAELIPILATIRESTRRDRYAQKFAFLSPLHNYDLGRAIASLLTDAEMYARQNKDGQSPRDQGYPRSEEANRQPLGEQPPPPTYRPPNQKQWGTSNAYPYTKEVIRRGEGGNNSQNNGFNKNGYQGKGQGRFKDGPVGDPTPPSLDMPTLSGMEKTERQLLRALFSPEWRVFILSRVRAEMLVTPNGQRLLEWVARTPANVEGGVDPIPLLHQAGEAEEKEELDKEIRRQGDKEREITSEGLRLTSVEDAGNGHLVASNTYFAPGAKFSDFIREVLEDSVSIASNERLNEAAVLDCIARLHKHHADRELQQLHEAMQRIDTLPPEQQRAVQQQYLEKMRARRGSPPPGDAAA